MVHLFRSASLFETLSKAVFDNMSIKTRRNQSGLDTFTRVVLRHSNGETWRHVILVNPIDPSTFWPRQALAILAHCIDVWLWIVRLVVRASHMLHFFKALRYKYPILVTVLVILFNMGVGINKKLHWKCSFSIEIGSGWDNGFPPVFERWVLRENIHSRKGQNDKVYRNALFIATKRIVCPLQHPWIEEKSFNIVFYVSPGR